ncbi:GMC oxidoreductase [Lysobacter arvi]|uniref:Cholesterol oxidase n=1 Tax=Lysobacter arvi TaxID=3038776 RepID=A0ABU1CHH9_9GAMM|nr:GMC oxidoreductase [Lysobacter arvi]MDR0184415.1 GMC oxidoreductase [Lysobacter arvi]
MSISRREFLLAATAVAAAGTFGNAAAKALPDDAANTTLLDRLAVSRYQRLVPEIFVPAPTAPSHVPAIVIGSGFGGAVAALRLGQAGVRTVVLERGLPWPRDPRRQIFSPEVCPDGRALWHRRSFTGFSGLPVLTDSFGGVLDITEYRHMQVWRGSAVGGGSVVFTGVLIEPERRFFDAVFKGRVSYDEMHAVYYPRARRMLRASPMPDDVYRSGPFGHSRAWDNQARKAGYTPQRIDSIFDWNVVRRELSGQSRRSAIIGESNFGNSNGAKYDLTYNYLPQAVATGKVSIHHSHVVRAIAQDRSGRFALTVDIVEPTGRVMRRQTMTCDKLFLGAGSIGTTELLVRAKATGTLPRLSAAIGQGWGTNGDAALVRSFAPSEGVTQASPCASRILDESGSLPVTLENWYAPGVALNIGLLGSLGMVLDPTRASFHYDAGRDDVVLDWPKNGNDRTVAALRAVHNRIARCNGVPAGVPLLVPDIKADFTAHPLGGVVLGEATDDYGMVNGYSGLYVVDGAMVPGSTGTVNPSLTITALAERTMEMVIGAGG